MRSRSVLAALTLSLVASTSACGGAAKPVGSDQGFHRLGRDTRVFDSYRQTADEVRRSLSLPARTRHVRVRMDCIGHGTITVSVFGGKAGAPCGDSSQPGGSIALSADQPIRRASTTRLDVRAPRGSTWSVAVDAGPGRIDPTFGQ